MSQLGCHYDQRRNLSASGSDELHLRDRVYFGLITVVQSLIDDTNSWFDWNIMTGNWVSSVVEAHGQAIVIVNPFHGDLSGASEPLTELLV